MQGTNESRAAAIWSAAPGPVHSPVASTASPSPPADLTPLLSKAAQTLEAGQPAVAINWANAALAVASSKDALIIRGLAYEQLREYEPATADFQAALRLPYHSPATDVMALDGRGRCERAQREREMGDLVDQLISQAQPALRVDDDLDNQRPQSPPMPSPADPKAKRKKNLSSSRNAKLADKGDVSPKSVVYPVRDDTLDCQYFLKTGKCNYGSKCKFNHPTRNKQLLVSLNRRDCFDYIQSGACPYGRGCKYNHPPRDGPLLGLKLPSRIPNSKVSVSSVSSISDSEEE